LLPTLLAASNRRPKLQKKRQQVSTAAPIGDRNAKRHEE
jgi:hypothetical protein